MKISVGKWYWGSRGFGGVSALKYLIKFKEYSFVDAVETLTGRIADWKLPPPVSPIGRAKVLLLPLKNKDCDGMTEYLLGVALTICSCSVSQTVRFMGMQTTTTLFFWKGRERNVQNMLPDVARWAALNWAFLAATSGILFVF